MKTPAELFFIYIEYQQAIVTGRCQKNLAVFAANLMTVLEVAIAPGPLHDEFPVVGGIAGPVDEDLAKIGLKAMKI